MRTVTWESAHTDMNPEVFSMGHVTILGITATYILMAHPALLTAVYSNIGFQEIHGLFQVCAQPMKDGVTL